MSSMWRVAFILPFAMCAATAASAQIPQPYQPAAAYTANVGYALNDWRRLRQSNGYSFADYARFLNANPGWPDEAKMRRWAETAMRPGENAPTVLTFYATQKPVSGNGYARLADAFAASGRMAEALSAARKAWAQPDLSTTDEQSIWARYGASFTRADHDDRVDALLFEKKGSDAARYLSMVSPERAAAFGARVAMQANAPDAETRYRYVIGSVTSDAGLMMDRARYLRANNYGEAAKDLAARSHNFRYRPADVERFYEMLLILAQDAQSSRQWATAYNIASQLDDALPPGTDLSTQSYGVRDDYTSLAWLAGRIAYDRLERYTGAVAMFDRYGQGGKSLQVASKGLYWAGRAASAGGQTAQANAYFSRAAAYPELFYGQLALERLGRSVPAPLASAAQYAATPTQRAAFNSLRLVQALRITGQQNRPTEQALFVQALAKALNNDIDRGLAVELAPQIRRDDLPVWVSRMARNDGSMFYVRQSYPSIAAAPSSSTVVHGITRQESSFDPYAVSHAGAMGMMQLMRGTAREQAGKIGVGYDGNRLLSDPSYNVLLGSTYFQRLLNMWDGNVPLAVASYNAGAGNVRKWINAYGDPRGQVDMIRWIEAIPFSETKGYVQRVIENSVVYDSLGRAQSQQSAFHVSRYLGKSRPG